MSTRVPVLQHKASDQHIISRVLASITGERAEIQIYGRVFGRHADPVAQLRQRRSWQRQPWRQQVCLAKSRMSAVPTPAAKCGVAVRQGPGTCEHHLQVCMITNAAHVYLSLPARVKSGYHGLSCNAVVSEGDRSTVKRTMRMTFTSRARSARRAASAPLTRAL